MCRRCPACISATGCFWNKRYLPRPPFVSWDFALQRRACSVGTGSRGSCNPQDASFADNVAASPSAALRILRSERNFSTKGDDVEVPPVPARRGGKSMMDGSTTKPDAKHPSKHVNSDHSRADASNKNNVFLLKLDELESGRIRSASTVPRVFGFLNRGVKEKILNERRKMLVFRDVGMYLDKPLLSRDVFLVLKYFRYGIEFAVDNELERMLRYFNEHALNELKIIQNSKLMRGPQTLTRKKCRSSSMAASFSLVPSFPVVKAAKLSQYCCNGKETYERLEKLAKQGTLGENAYRYSLCSQKPLCFNRRFDERDPQQLTTLSKSAFRQPAVVIYSQLGQKFGAQADLEWRRLAYSTIDPSILDCFPKEDVRGKGHVVSKTEQHIGGLRHRTQEGTGGSKIRRAPIDVISLRSMDVYRYRWVHKLYVRRFTRSLISPALSLSDNAEGELLGGLITAFSTFVGSKLLEPFYTSVGIRNYLSPHVMLVDHEGMIRWISAGCPDDYEKEHFPFLLRQLEDEYRQSVKK
uniref:Uncharacterized protein n=1 Tax=Trypanosoma congolense (strain IL3000) TaxID=1068625 RepID=G0UMT8_TRYCI|nr:conserved hypothetical protein [Trypanosoma congolense IL3000]